MTDLLADGLGDDSNIYMTAKKCPQTSDALALNAFCMKWSYQCWVMCCHGSWQPLWWNIIYIHVLWSVQARKLEENILAGWTPTMYYPVSVLLCWCRWWSIASPFNAGCRTSQGLAHCWGHRNLTTVPYILFSKSNHAKLPKIVLKLFYSIWSNSFSSHKRCEHVWTITAPKGSQQFEEKQLVLFRNCWPRSTQVGK